MRTDDRHVGRGISALGFAALLAQQLAGPFPHAVPPGAKLPLAGKPQTITTINDIRFRVKTNRLHAMAMLEAQGKCPPAPGCTIDAKPLSASGELDLSSSSTLIEWQYSQSPLRLELTKSCAKTYAADGTCYAPGFPQTFLDMDLASSADPSHGRQRCLQRRLR